MKSRCANYSLANGKEAVAFIFVTRALCKQDQDFIYSLSLQTILWTDVAARNRFFIKLLR